MFLHLSVSHFVHGGHAWQWGGVCLVEGMHVGETATEAGGTHPTGMHSCY